jgi:molybdopterin molybdotransferase
VEIRGPAAPGAFIRKKGADLRRGQTLIRAGQVIHPEHLPLLAQLGIAAVRVYRLPRVAVLCTGSELLDLPATPLPGQIISGNPFLLAALIRRSGGIPLDLGIVGDDVKKIQTRLKKSLAGPADLVITTGGMGPGKFDCITEALVGMGVKIFYRQLAVRPGRATLFGVQQGKPIFALPGPPPAVFPLFHELVIPGLRRMQGHPHHLLRKLRVNLQEEMELKKSGCQQLKAGVLTTDKGILTVRPAKKHEPAEVIMLIPACRRRMRAGEKISVHLIAYWSSPCPPVASSPCS